MKFINVLMYFILLSYIGYKYGTFDQWLFIMGYIFHIIQNYLDERY